MKLKLSRFLLRDDRGQNTLEWTVAFPFFMLVVWSLIVFGWYWWSQTTAATAIHDGTYLAARRGGSIEGGLIRTQELLNAALGGNSDDFMIRMHFTGRSVWGSVSNDRTVRIPFLGDIFLQARASSFQRREQFYGGPPPGWW